jgi:hypothetical protein
MGDAPQEGGQEQAAPQRDPVTGRLLPGHAKMGGRKKGSRLKGTLAIEALFSGSVKKVARKVVREANNGQSWAAKLVIERIVPPAREAPIEFDLRSVKTAQEAVSATQDVLAQVAAGKMSIGDGERVCAMLNLLLRAFEVTDHAERLEALEARLEQAGLAAPVNGRRYELHG